MRATERTQKPEIPGVIYLNPQGEEVHEKPDYSLSLDPTAAEFAGLMIVVLLCATGAYTIGAAIWGALS